MDPIQLSSIKQIAPVELPAIRPAAAGDAFQAMFQSALNKVDSTHQNAAVKIDRFLSGEGEELHRVVMAAQQAELSFEMFQQMRNKVVQAYQEIMRMQM